MSGWPTLRSEVRITPASADRMGAPRWLLEDRIRNSFFNIDWPTYEILIRWNYGDSELIVESINQQTTLALTKEDVEAVKKFLDTRYLLNRWQPQEALGLVERLREQQKSWLHKLMHGYLFFRLPLLNPDALLERWLPLGQFLLSKNFLYLSLGMLLFTLFQISQQWNMFATTFVDTLTLEGLLAYLLALVIVKIIHEFGHAFAVKQCGVPVPTMGVAFLVLFPMAYTDMNQAWKVNDRNKRIDIATAGVRLELLVAIWAAFLWLILPEGPLKSATFFLATISWILTLTLNASPFLRFDGYFLLMDWLNYPNLHERSAAIARWQLRRVLFADASDCPESLTPGFLRFLVVFAWITWAYRFVVFIGIALLIYFKVTKLLGTFLAAVEIYWFILKPVLKEMKFWWESRIAYIQNLRTRKTLLAGLLVLVVFFLPLPYPIKTAAVIWPSDFQQISLSQPGQLLMLPVVDGQFVQKDEVLSQFSSDAALFRLMGSQLRESEAQRLLEKASISPNNDFSYDVLISRYRAEVGSRQSAEFNLRRLELRTSSGGLFRLNDPDVSVGDWLQGRTSLGFIIPQDSAVEAVAWLESEAFANIKVGASAKVYTLHSTRPWYGQVIALADDAATELPVRALASSHFGNVHVREHLGKLVPERAVYRVTIRLDDVQSKDLNSVLYGQVSIRSAPRSIGGQYLRAVGSTFVREFTP